MTTAARLGAAPLVIAALLTSLAACRITDRTPSDESSVNDTRGKVVARVDVRVRNHVNLTIDPVDAGLPNYARTVPRSTTCDVREWYPDCLNGE